MPILTLANATDIVRWADTRSSQERLPELLRRLVHATTRAATLVDFPSGDAVQLAGWDGVVEIDEDHAEVPRGLSGWETGVTSNPKGKADDDYEKRTASPPPTARGAAVPEDTTFVFVTPRRWSRKEEWAQARRKEGKWKDVRVLDADDLESWLQRAPATHVWFSRILSLIPAGTDDADTVWADWSESTRPATTSALAIAGRIAAATQVLDWLRRPGGSTLTVSSESEEDAIGFVLGTLMNLSSDERVPLLSRTVVVSEPDAFIQLASSPEPLVLIPRYGIGAELMRGVRGGHHVLVPAGPIPRSVSSTQQLVLPRVHRRDVEHALASMGIRGERARDLAGIARRSMLSLRRRIAATPVMRVPAWASAEAGLQLVPMLLLGQFDQAQDADLQALARVSGRDLDQLRRVLERWSVELDPPVRRTGSLWYLVSNEDAWDLLRPYVTDEDLARFAEVAKEVLREIHPRYDLPPEQRWAAAIRGKERQYSETLVAGIADSLALLGTLGEVAPPNSGVSTAAAVGRIVREIFDAVAGDWRGWATLSPVLPLLAEAAPDVFLNAVNAQIARDEEAVRKLFADEGDVLFSTSSHTGLLWALETLAWSPQHLGYVARLLATLDRLDPGGRISNRPRESLRTIFLAWLPQTSADVETRLAILDDLRRREPLGAWRLMVSLLPRLHDHSVNTPRPRWRDWVVEGAGTGATYRDIWRQTSVVVGWMVSDAGKDASRWVTLIEALPDLGPEEFELITAALAARLAEKVDDQFRAPIYDALRSLLGRHRSYPGAQWALSADRLERLQQLYDSSVPTDVFPRLRWLYSNHPQLPEGREDDFESRQRLLLENQGVAARELVEVLGLEGLIKRAEDVDRPDELGRTAALSGAVPEAEEDGLLARLVRAQDRPTVAFGRGYAVGWTQRVGEDVALEQIRTGGSRWPDDVRGQLLLSQKPSDETLNLVAELDASGQAAYWSRVYGFWLDDPVVERGLREMLRHGRFHAVIDAAAMHARRHQDIDPELLAEALERAPSQRTDPDGTQMDAHDVGAVLDILETAAVEGRFDEQRLAKIEFLYLPVLGHHTREPKTLHKALASNPSLFVDAVRLAYRATGEEPKELTPDQAGLAEQAYRLLDTFRTVPGSTATGIDAEAMNRWVDDVRTEVAAAGRSEIGDLLVGMAMSGPATDTDGAWPRIPIRDLIERLESDEFERGLEISRYNSRGVVTRNPFDGGGLERAEAATYERMAATVGTHWARTAAMLRRLAEGALRDARREDIAAELREDIEG